MPTNNFVLHRVYWWKHSAALRVPVKVTEVSSRHVTVRIMTISEHAALWSGLGCGELVHLLNDQAILEPVTVAEHEAANPKLPG